MKGIFFVIKSGGNGEAIFNKVCRKKKSVEEFKICMDQNTKLFIKQINIKSFKHEILPSSFFTAQMIFPKDGSIGSNKTDYETPTLRLDPSFEYVLRFFDKDFFLYLNNPLIVQRSTLRIKRNSTFLHVHLKVQ